MVNVASWLPLFIASKSHNNIPSRRLSEKEQEALSKYNKKLNTNYNWLMTMFLVFWAIIGVVTKYFWNVEYLLLLFLCFILFRVFKPFILLLKFNEEYSKIISDVND